MLAPNYKVKDSLEQAADSLADLAAHLKRTVPRFERRQFSCEP